MQPGDLRDRGTLEEIIEAAPEDDYGEHEQVWQPLIDRWLKVEPLRGRELFSAQQANSLVSHKITMRYSDKVKPQQRWNIKGRYLYITDVINTGNRSQWLLMMCTEHVD